MKDKIYWREALKEVDKIYVVGIDQGKGSWDRGIWRKFRLYYIKNGDLVQITIEGDDHPTYWVPRHMTKSGKYIGAYFENAGLGSDRVFEIVYSLGQWLYYDGYKFKAEFLSYL